MIDQLLTVLFIIGAAGTAVGLLALILQPILDDARADRIARDVRRITGAFAPAHALGTASGTSGQIARWNADTQTFDASGLWDLLDKQDAAAGVR